MIVVVIYLLNHYSFMKEHKSMQSKRLAHQERFTKTKNYAKLYRNYYFCRNLSLICLFFAIFSGIALSGRPATRKVERPEVRNRDIMLCLDISGSMVETDLALIQTFKNLAESFNGERMGLTIFDSSSQRIFPLTDDYNFIASQLETLIENYKNNEFLNFEGTYQGDGSSLIGDGLGSCVIRFDQLDTKRSRSIILATDNQVSGNQLINLPQAIELAKKRGIRVYGINPNDSSSDYYNDEASDEFKKGTLDTKGGYYTIRYGESADQTVIEDIVKKISEQEATRFKGAPQVIKHDEPAILTVLFCMSLIGSLLAMKRLIK